MRHLLLQTKITLLGMVLMVSVVLLAIIGYRAIDTLMGLAQLDLVNRLTYHSMDLDMMHDALHNDVLMLQKAQGENNLAQVEDILKTLDEHAVRAEENIVALEALKLPELMQNQVAAANKEFSAYILQARAQQQLANLSAFQESFENLETTMEELGAEIVAWSDRIKQQGSQHAETARQQLMLVLVIATLLAIITPLYISLRLFMPMKKLLQHCHALCAEEYEAEVPYTQRHDEVGILANSLEVLRQKAGEAFRLRQVLDDLPISVMTADMRDEFRINYANKQSQHLLRGIQKHLPVSVDKLIGTSIDVFHKDPMRIRHLLQTPEHLPHRAKVQIGDEVMQLQASAIYDKKGNYLSPVLAWDMITGKEKLSDNFESSVGSVVNTLVGAAGDLEERAVTLQGAIEELSITAADISSRASDSLKIVRDSNEKGEEARNCMLQLAEAAEQITSVVTLISSIADKTNLLALNATIESARAGEAGRGFAVVASEVKTLANQTSDAITGIAARITEIQQVSQRARSAVQEICEGVSSIEEVATGIAGTIEQQRASTSEIARHISGGVVNHLGTDYGSVLTYAMQLKEVSQTLKVECGAFLESVRKM